jgi:two-component system response regulator YesN
MSFVDYLKRIRVEKAKELLSSTDFKIHEVALRVGYDNPKYFARIFREMTGVSPQEFKK